MDADIETPAATEERDGRRERDLETYAVGGADVHF